ncbi:LTA synthase family protein [Bifidobacterium pullorum]|uniref:LTA synthase family protein n=1 Tax=Bifidobacterium pullorum TaxID=78448 RepID=UPI003F7CBEE6
MSETVNERQAPQGGDIEELHIARPGGADGGARADGGSRRRAKRMLGVMRKERWMFPGWLYAVIFVAVDAVCVGILEWGVSLSATRVQLSSPTVGWGFLTKMFTQANFVCVLNMLLLGIVYLALLMLFNRFWIATPLILALAIIIAVIEHFKVSIRYEAILPADLSFLKADAGNLMSFMPPGAHWVVLGAAVAGVALFALCWVLYWLDGRHGRVFRSGADPRRTALNTVCRLLLIIVPGGFLTLYTMQVSTVGSWAKSFSSAMGDIPSMWDSVYDAQRNGPLVAFLRQLNPKVMDKPADYSEETMRQVAARYEKAADQINRTRSANMTDSSVVYILSESFSDPARVPGLKMNQDAMPQIRQIKEHTTSGLMLSSGYGGGTANLEYMGLTGLSMANFDSSLTSPYQQLVPTEHWMPTINQMWGAPKHSIGLHPYESSMYSRATNYKKFGFGKFYTLTGPDVISHQDKLGSSPYVSDAASYQSTLEELRKTDKPQFLQLITMQNHMPYHEWYPDNEFHAESTTGTPLEKDERMSIETYAKGAEITDQATKEFLDELDKLDKPVTVVFYGDHLPGIYSSASQDENNSLALHLTDYFIWSNQASASHGTKIGDDEYSSPNFFIAQAAEHMDAKVSPYIAFLTELHAKVAAMEPPVVNKIQGWNQIPEGSDIYLDPEGKPMNPEDFDAATKRLVDDYRLIQYDITDGANYLKDTDFMNLPE